MPTLNEYTDDPGYFVRARPSSVESPITYQIQSEGYAIIDSYGLTHGDQISWSIIQSLKSLGLLYTGDSGVIGSDEFDPDPEQLKDTKLEKPAAHRLAKVIVDNIDLTPSQLSEILTILSIDPDAFEYDASPETGNTSTPTTPKASQMPNFPVHNQIDVLNGETIYKTSDWWKAAILADGYQGSELLVYLWRKDGASWKRKQKYKVKSDDWETEKQVIDRLLSQET